jgi:hypothetical protein
MAPTILTYQYVQSIDNANNLSHAECNEPRQQAYIVSYDKCIIHLGTKCNSMMTKCAVCKVITKDFHNVNMYLNSPKHLHHR